MNIFTYGSLMFSEVWSRVVKGDYRAVPGILKGYRRTAVVGEEYPVVYPTNPNDAVHGILYYEVSREDVERLDRFEGDYYFRQKEQIDLEGNCQTAAGVYVLRDAYRSIASDSEWSVERFRQTGITRFLSAYAGFGSKDLSD